MNADSRTAALALRPALAGLLLLAALSTAGETASPPGSDGIVDENAAPAPELPEEAGSETARSAAANPLLRDAALVIAGKAEGVDTEALLAGIREKAKWGELPERLAEAEGILLFGKGDVQGASIALRRLAHPGPMALGILGEGHLRKGDRYEAAAHFLKAARAFPPEDGRAPEYYRKYLELKPENAAVEAELALRLEKLGRLAEAAPLFAKDTARSAADPATALRVGALLSGQGFAAEALALYRRALVKHPSDKSLRLRLAAALESAGRRVEAARAYADAWDLDPADRVPRDRALAHFEAAGAAQENAYRELLEKSVALEEANPVFRFKLAVACLAASDRASAYLHLSEALASDPKNPSYLARLPEAIESDDQIRTHFPVLRAGFEKRGGSARLVELAARGYALAGMEKEAARAWYQLHALSPAGLEGRREAVLSLAATGDPAYLSLAGRLAGPMAAKAPEDKEVGLILLRALLLDGKDSAAAAQAVALLKAFPETAPEALAAAKSMLARGKTAPAKSVLQESAAAAPSPDISFLLGGILHGEKDCRAAVDPLSAATEAYPGAFPLLGECLEVLQDPLRAALAYQSHFDRQGDKESLLSQARVQRSLQDPALERPTLETLVAKGWAGEADRLRLAAAHAALGDSARAAEVYEGLYRNRSQVPAESAWVEAGAFLGRRLAAEGRQDKAIRILNLVLRADPARADLWRLLGGCQASRRQWKAAWESYAAAEAAGESSPELSRLQVEAALRLGDRKVLAKAYASLFRHEPVSGEPNDFLAEWHQGQRNYLDAAHHFRVRLAEHPEDVRAWEGLGNCLALAGELEAAGEALQKAIDLGADSDETYVNRARVYRREGAKDMAASMMGFLADRNPRCYLALVWSARFAEEDGDSASAQALFRKAARLRPPKTAWPELASQGLASASTLPAAASP